MKKRSKLRGGEQRGLRFCGGRWRSFRNRRSFPNLRGRKSRGEEGCNDVVAIAIAIATSCTDRTEQNTQYSGFPEIPSMPLLLLCFPIFQKMPLLQKRQKKMNDGNHSSVCLVLVGRKKEICSHIHIWLTEMRPIWRHFERDIYGKAVDDKTSPQ